MEKKLKNFILAIIILVFYLLHFDLFEFILKLIGVNIASSITSTIIFSVISDIIFIIFLFLIYHKSLKEELIDYKNNLKSYFKFGICVWLVGLAIMIVSNLAISTIYPSNATNEEMVQEMIKVVPLYMIFSSCVVAPFVEEIIFRKSIKNFINNDILYIIVSGVVFGFIHIAVNLSQYLYIIPYGALGCCFAYMYSKKKNIFISIFIHMLHNSILVFFSLLNYFVLN